VVSSSPSEDRERLSNLIRSIAGEQASYFAGNLLREFGALQAVMGGDHERIAQISNRDIADLITSAWSTCRLALRQVLETRPIISTSQALIDYLRSEMAFLPNEEVHVLFLTSRLRLITERVIARGNGREAAIRPRVITALAKTWARPALSSSTTTRRATRSRVAPISRQLSNLIRSAGRTAFVCSII
jgi:DNA repair protein RadC